MDYRVEGVRRGGRLKASWTEVAVRDCKTRQLNK